MPTRHVSIRPVTPAEAGQAARDCGYTLRSPKGDRRLADALNAAAEPPAVGRAASSSSAADVTAATEIPDAVADGALIRAGLVIAAGVLAVLVLAGIAAYYGIAAFQRKDYGVAFIAGVVIPVMACMTIAALYCESRPRPQVATIDESQGDRRPAGATSRKVGNGELGTQDASQPPALRPRLMPERDISLDVEA